MYDIVVIVSDHGPRLNPPVMAREGTDRLFFFFDHRHPPSERQAFIAARVPINQIRHTDAYAFDPVENDCTTGAHRWIPVLEASGMTAVRCARCCQIDKLPVPYPGDIEVEHLAHA